METITKTTQQAMLIGQNIFIFQQWCHLVELDHPKSLIEWT